MKPDRAANHVAAVDGPRMGLVQWRNGRGVAINADRGDGGFGGCSKVGNS
jgi:hypothetical protein